MLLWKKWLFSYSHLGVCCTFFLCVYFFFRPTIQTQVTHMMEQDPCSWLFGCHYGWKAIESWLRTIFAESAAKLPDLLQLQSNNIAAGKRLTTKIVEKKRKKRGWICQIKKNKPDDTERLNCLRMIYVAIKVYRNKLELSCWGTVSSLRTSCGLDWVRQEAKRRGICRLISRAESLHGYRHITCGSHSPLPAKPVKHRDEKTDSNRKTSCFLLLLGPSSHVIRLDFSDTAVHREKAH